MELSTQYCKNLYSYRRKSINSIVYNRIAEWLTLGGTSGPTPPAQVVSPRDSWRGAHIYLCMRTKSIQHELFKDMTFNCYDKS